MKPIAPTRTRLKVEQRRRRRAPEEVRGLILEAARAEFGRAGYGGATTASIAARARTTEAQLFRYFRSKAELFRAAVLVPLDDAFEAFNASRLAMPDPGDGWAEAAIRYITDLVDFIGEHRDPLMSLVVAQDYGGGSVDGVAGVEGLRAYFALGAERMRGRSQEHVPVSPELMVRVSFGAVLAAVLFRDWLFSGTGAKSGEITQAMVDFVRFGININHPKAVPDTTS